MEDYNIVRKDGPCKGAVEFISLTDQEVEKIYRKREKEYRLLNIKKKCLELIEAEEETELRIEPSYDDTLAILPQHSKISAALRHIYNNPEEVYLKTGAMPRLL